MVKLNQNEHLTGENLFKAVLLSQLLILIVATIFSFFLFDSANEFRSLFKWEWTFIWIGLISGVFVALLDIYFMRKLPPAMYDDGGINVLLFSSINVWKIGVVAAGAALTEEILFRGVIQTHFGIVIASLVFVLIHYRYLRKWYLLINMTVLSFFIGGIYEYTESLWSVIFLHFIIDYILGIYIYITSKHKEGVHYETRSF